MRHPLRCLVAYALLFLPQLHASAQALYKVIEFDTLTNPPKESLPFDQPFVLKIPLEGNTVQAVALIPRFLNLTLEESLALKFDSQNADETGIVAPKEIKLPSISKKNFKVVTDEKGKSTLFLTIKDDDLLDPERRYTLLIATETLPELLEIFKDIDESETGANAATKSNAKQDAQKKIDALSDKILKKMGVRSGIFPEQRGFDRLKKVYEDSKLAEQFKVIRDSQAALTANEGASTSEGAFKGNQVLPGFLSIVVDWDPTLDKEFKSANVSTAAMSQIVNTLYTLTKEQYRAVRKGSLSITCLDCKPVADDALEKRKANLSTTIEALQKLRTTSFMLYNKYTARLSVTENSRTVSLHEKVDAFLDELKTRFQKPIKDILTARASISEKLGENPNFATPLLLDSDTFVLNFMTRSKLSIVPDFGIVAPAFAKAEDQVDYKFLPYLGIQINLRPINKDLPFWSYRHRFSHFPTLQLGYTLVSIAKDKKRVNFFEKSAFLTGVGLRLGNSLKVIGGGMWYFRVVPGQEEFKFSAIPYLGLSIDLDLKQITGDFVEKVFPTLSKGRAVPATAPAN